MALKACVVCGRASRGARCPRHAIMAPVYDAAHRARRRSMLAGAIGHPCPICGVVIRRGDDLDLDHTTSAITHASCNRRAGASLVN